MCACRTCASCAKGVKSRQIRHLGDEVGRRRETHTWLRSSPGLPYLLSLAGGDSVPCDLLRVGRRAGLPYGNESKG